MHPDQLKNEIIRPTLALMGTQYGMPEAVDLLMGTAAQESHLGTFVRQLGGGPAVGIYQMEPATFHDLFANYLGMRPEMMEMIARVCGTSSPPAEQMVWDLRLATVMARLHYWRIVDPIPMDLEGQAKYWKRTFNTVMGAGTTDEYCANYKLRVEGKTA